MTRDDIKQTLLSAAREAAIRGPGWSQEAVVLRNAGKQLAPGGRDLASEQLIIEVWHELFAKGDLAWGYDLNNPGSPFFHIPRSA